MYPSNGSLCNFLVEKLGGGKSIGTRQAKTYACRRSWVLLPFLSGEPDFILFQLGERLN